MSASEHNLYSSYREMLLEHMFTGAVMRHLWLSGITRMEMLKPQVDDSGYDLVLEAKNIVRHVQLKSSHLGAATPKVNIHTSLAGKPSGCVIWIYFDPTTLDLGPFYWFGAAPGNPLPDICAYPIAKHTKMNAQNIRSERPNIRVIPKASFTKLLTIDEVVARLFG